MADQPQEPTHEIFLHRYHPDQLADLEREVQFNLRLLWSAYKTTDPTIEHDGAEPQWGIDGESFKCLSAIGGLMGALSGWAIDHEIGKAVEHVGHFVMERHGSFDPKKVPRYERFAETANSSEAEKLGSQVRGREFDSDNKHNGYSPSIQRQMLINILRPIALTANVTVLQDLVEALEALNQGEILPLLIPVKGAPTGHTIANLKLDAWRYIEYQAARCGKKKEVAKREVLEAYGMGSSSDRTVDYWKRQASEKLGHLFVAQELGRVGELGDFIKKASNSPNEASKDLYRKIDPRGEMTDKRYGPERLLKLGIRFRNRNRPIEGE